jgi:hypothetical protein
MADNTVLAPPSTPFSTAGSSSPSLSPRNDAPLLPNDGSPVSLSVNYLPHKFSSSLLAPGARRRKGKGAAADAMLPKRGGGVEAFRNGEARMPGAGDDDYDGLSGDLFGRNAKPRLRWNKFKWTLFVANVFVSVHSLFSLSLSFLFGVLVD